MSEKQLHQSVCDYIRYKHPHVLLNVDLSGQNMSPMIGAQLKRLRSNSGYPDIMVYKARTVLVKNTYAGNEILEEINYHGFFLELKVEGYKLFNKKGEYKTDHLKNQAECMRRLREEGYYAEFASGIDEAIFHIDKYFN
jgi:hypothetical protein